MVDFEMKGYLQHKAINALESIVDIVETLNSARPFIPANVANQLQNGLRANLHDSTKVVAYLYDSLDKQDWSDADAILEGGKKGLDRVLFKYGCRAETDEMRRDRERPAFARRVLDLSKGDRRMSRRAIYDECYEFGRNDTLSAQIDILLEGVTQNTKEWTQFQIEMEQLLSPFCESELEISSSR